MEPTKKQIYEKVAKKEITIDSAFDLISKINGSIHDVQNQTSIYTKVFHYNEDILKDHRVFGEQIILGVVHCSLAINAVKERYPDRLLHGIRKVNFVDAIRVSPFEKVLVNVQIKEENGKVSFKNLYKILGKQEYIETVFGDYIFERFDPDISIKKLDIQSILRASNKFVSTNDFYKNQDIYGPSLYTLKRFYIVHDGVFGEIRLTPQMSSQIDEYLIHPALFDAGCQNSVFCAAQDHFGKDLCIPLFIKQIYILDNVPEHCYCYSKIKKKTEEILIADTAYYDREGNPVMSIEGLSLKRVHSMDALFSNKSLQYLQKRSSEDRNKMEIMDETNMKSNKSSTNQFDKNFYERLQYYLEDYITVIIKPLIKSPTQSLNRERNFMDLGVDSLQLIQVTQQLEKQFEIELYPTLFFEYQNIKELAEFFSREYTETFSQYFGLKQDIVADDSNIPLQAGIVNDIESKKDYLQSDLRLKKGISESVNKIEASMMKTEEKEIKKNVNDIAVIGMSGIFADSPDLNAFWENLINKKDLIKEIPIDHFDYRPWFDSESQTSDKMYCKWGSFINCVDRFDAGFFNITPKEAEVMDPQMRLLLQVLYATAEDAGYPYKIKGSKTGMYVGICFHDYYHEMIRLGKKVAPHDGTGNSSTMMANRPSFYFDLKGPSIAIDTACSSSLVALHLACKALQNNECEMAFAAGTNLLLSSWHYRYFCSITALSYTGRCYTFDKRADGYVPGEGVGAVLLKSLEKAITDGDQIHAVIKGSAINHGGYTPSITAPSVNLEAQVILDAWDDANIDPRTLGYIEAHGTGTKLGDPVEINGLKNAFHHHGIKDEKCAIGSAKAHIGHTEAAAGVAGVIKTVLSLKHKKIPAMPMFEELNSYIQLEDSPLYINTEAIEWEKKDNIPRRAGVSSFGFGGAYAHVVLEEYDDTARYSQVQTRLEKQEPQIILLSAKNEERLKEYAGKILEYLEKNNLSGDEVQSSVINIENIAYTLQLGRKAMTERMAAIVSSTQELIEKLCKYCNGESDIEDLYTGRNRTEGEGGSEFLKLLLQGRAGKEFLRIIIEDKELHQLARMWVSGADIDWKKLYMNANHIPRLISLPTYPFAKIRHWFFEPGILGKDEMKVYPAEEDENEKKSFKKQGVQDKSDTAMKQIKATEIVNTNKIGAMLGKKISEITGIPLHEIDYDDDFSEIGIDSIQSMGIVREIETQFDFRMYVSELRELNTINKLTDFLVRELHTLNEESISKPLTSKKKSQKRPVLFVFSTPRSGSTLFRVMLMGHSEIFSPPELMLLPYRTMKEWSEDLYAKKWEHFKDGFIESIKELEGISAKQAVERVNEFVKDELPIEKAYQMLQILAKGSYVVDKTPPYALDIKTLCRAETVCENPFYIYLFRHPLSVMESLVRNRFDKMMGIKCDDPWALSEQAWRNMNKNIQEFLSSIPNERKMQVCFEELVQRPEMTMKKVCRHLNIKFEEAMINPYEGKRMIKGLHDGVSSSAGDPNFLIHRKIDPKSADTWQKCLNKINILTPETINLAERLGYSFNGRKGNLIGTIKKIEDIEHERSNPKLIQEQVLKRNELSLPQKSIFSRLKIDPLWGLAQHYRVEMKEGLDRKRLEESLKKVIQKHRVLRCYFKKEQEEWVQYEKESPFIHIVFGDLTDMGKKELKGRLANIEKELIADLKIDSAPLIRIAVVEYERYKYEFIVVIHMLITDGLTSMIINRDLSDFYWHPEKPAKNDSRYDEYVKEVAALEKGGLLKEHLEFWKKHIRGKPVVCPVDKKDGPDIVKSEKVYVSKYTLYDFGIENEAMKDDFFYCLMAGLYKHLSKWAKNSNPVLAFRLHRRNVGLKGNYFDVAGRFAGEIPLRMSVESDASAVDLIKRFQKLFKEIPLGGITYEILAQKGLLPPASEISPIVVNYQPLSFSGLHQEVLDTLKAHQFESPENKRLYQMDLIIRQNNNQIIVIVKYSKNQFNESTIKKFIHEWKYMTEKIITEAQIVKELSISAKNNY